MHDATDFATELSAARTQSEAFAALYRFSDIHIPVRLWTIMLIDPDAGLAHRAFTNMPDVYPPSGTKPLVDNAWSEIVRGQHKCFVANTLSEIAEVFPDHALIGSLGCESVLNLPVVEGGQVIGTVNLLDAEDHFTPARVTECMAILPDPARAAMQRARDLPER